MRSSVADYCAQTADGFREDVVSRAYNPRRSVPSSVETTTACETVVIVRSVSSDRSGQERETPKNRRAVAVDAALVAAVSVANAFAIGAEQEAGTKEPDALAYLLGGNCRSVAPPSAGVAARDGEHDGACIVSASRRVRDLGGHGAHVARGDRSERAQLSCERPVSAHVLSGPLSGSS
jgi:hypothetical protein